VSVMVNEERWCLPTAHARANIPTARLDVDRILGAPRCIGDPDLVKVCRRRNGVWYLRRYHSLLSLRGVSWAVPYLSGDPKVYHVNKII